jgi:hypothetical protein
VGRIVAAQVEIESKAWKKFITSQFQEHSSRRFQPGSHRFKLHRPAVWCIAAADGAESAGKLGGIGIGIGIGRTQLGVDAVSLAQALRTPNDRVE